MYTPARLEVRVTKYPKYVCVSHPECGVLQAERPESLVEGNKYDTSVAAGIITARYGYHLRFYRQQDLFAGSGWFPSRSTLFTFRSTFSISHVRPPSPLRMSFPADSFELVCAIGYLHIQNSDLSR